MNSGRSAIEELFLPHVVVRWPMSERQLRLKKTQRSDFSRSDGTETVSLERREKASLLDRRGDRSIRRIDLHLGFIQSTTDIQISILNIDRMHPEGQSKKREIRLRSDRLNERCDHRRLLLLRSRSIGKRDVSPHWRRSLRKRDEDQQRDRGRGEPCCCCSVFVEFHQ